MTYEYAKENYYDFVLNTAAFWEDYLVKEKGRYALIAYLPTSFRYNDLPTERIKLSGLSASDCAKRTNF